MTEVSKKFVPFKRKKINIVRLIQLGQNRELYVVQTMRTKSICTFLPDKFDIKTTVFFFCWGSGGFQEWKCFVK